MKRGPKPETIAFMAFNRTIAKTLAKRVPAGVEASTMHSFGLRAICRGGKKPAVERDKVEMLLEEMEGKDIRTLKEQRGVFVGNCCRLVDLARYTLAGWTEEEGFIAEKVDAGVVEALAERYELTLEGTEAEKVPLLLDRCRRQRGMIDFADMIWQPIVNGLTIPRFDLLCVDEGQDLNRCQQELALKAGRRIVMFGDDRQAIYGFAGADTDSLPRMEASLGERGGCEVLPLTVTRRCGRAIVEEAKALVPDFEAHESNGPGIIENTDDRKMFELAKGGEMVLCRVNAPLAMYAFRWIKAGRKANIQGRDIGVGLLALVKRFKATGTPELVGKVDDWYNAECARLAKRKSSGMAYLALQDKRDCLLAFTEGTKEVSEVTAAIRKVFDTQGKGEEGMRDDTILLSSIHRAKGLEARRNWLLGPELLPHPKATSKWARGQEDNLKYVAITRAIENLTYVPLPQREKEE